MFFFCAYYMDNAAYLIMYDLLYEFRNPKILIKFILTLIKIKCILKKIKNTDFEQGKKKEETMKISWNVIALLLVLGVTVAFFAMILWLANKYLSRRQ